MKQSNVKGQAAIEYMTVFGIALLVSTPFIIEAQNTIMDLRESTSSMALQSSLDDLEIAIDVVSASGEPAVRTFPIELPDNLNSTSIEENATIIEVNTPQGTSTHFRTFDINVSGELPDSSGNHMIRTEATSDGVEVVPIS